MDAVGVAEEGEDGRLVERHPVLDAIAQVRREERGVVAEPAHDLRVGEAAAVLQRLRQVPVEQVDQRLDARVEQGVDEALVEVEARLVDGAGPRGQDARPADAEPVCARPELGHEADVLRVPVVVVTRDVARAAIGDRARLGARRCPRSTVPGRPRRLHPRSGRRRRRSPTRSRPERLGTAGLGRSRSRGMGSSVNRTRSAPTRSLSGNASWSSGIVGR